MPRILTNQHTHFLLIRNDRLTIHTPKENNPMTMALDHPYTQGEQPDDNGHRDNDIGDLQPRRRHVTSPFVRVRS